MRTTRIFTSAVLAGGLALTSLSAVSVATPVAGAASLPKCPMSTLNNVTAPVQISFWEAMSRANETEIESLANAFNASQSKVHVNVVQQGGYDVTWSKWQAGLTTGQLPAMAMIGDTNQQGIVDSRSILPVQACENATNFSTKTFLPRIMSYWKINGVQQGLPFNVSAPILYYNKQAFTKAGIASAPATLPQLIVAANKLKASGQGGMGLKLDPWHMEAWLATSNQLFVNNNNGRSGRASSAAFNNATGLNIFTQLNALVKSGAASTNPATGSSAYDNLLGIGGGKFSMTIDTSAALGTISGILGSGQYPNVTLGVAPFPTLTTSPKGAIQAGGAALYISNKVPAVQQAAAWQFMSWLDSAANQAAWSIATGYVPIRTDAASQSSVQQYWAANPAYQVAYNMLKAGPTTPATSGAAIGPYDQVRAAINTAEVSMYTAGVKPKAAINAAANSVTSILKGYNSRVG